MPYNDAPPSSGRSRGGEVASFIVEPVMENIGICLPDDGYLQAVRTTSRTARVLIFDEVKTGITAGSGGATGHYGVLPDLVTLPSRSAAASRSAPSADAGVHGPDHQRPVLHLGTYNGNPLVMAAARATLAEACSAEATDAAIARNERLAAACPA